MKQVSEVTLQQALAAGRKAPKAQPQSLDLEAQQVVVSLFRELKAIFPAWRNAWPSGDDEAAARRSWIKAFAAAGLRNLDQIRYGVERCRQSASPFMPSVGEFIQWCQPTPEMLGCPSVEQAFLQACQLAHPAADQRGVHPAVWHAACEAGLNALRNLPENRSKPLFERAYLITLRMVERGEKLRSIPKALPKSVHVPASPEKQRDAVAKMRHELRATA